MSCFTFTHLRAAQFSHHWSLKQLEVQCLAQGPIGWRLLRERRTLLIHFACLDFLKPLIFQPQHDVHVWPLDCQLLHWFSSSLTSASIFIKHMFNPNLFTDETNSWIPFFNLRTVKCYVELLNYFWMSGLLSGQEIHLSKAEALKLCTHYTAFKKVSLQQFHYHL